MVEGQDLAQVERHASDIADAVRAALGAGAPAQKKPAAASSEPVAARI
jgi:hypothetical protein